MQLSAQNSRPNSKVCWKEVCIRQRLKWICTELLGVWKHNAWEEEKWSALKLMRKIHNKSERRKKSRPSGEWRVNNGPTLNLNILKNWDPRPISAFHFNKEPKMQWWNLAFIVRVSWVAFVLSYLRPSSTNLLSRKKELTHNCCGRKMYLGMQPLNVMSISYILC